MGGCSDSNLRRYKMGKGKKAKKKVSEGVLQYPNGQETAAVSEEQKAQVETMVQLVEYFKI